MIQNERLNSILQRNIVQAIRNTCDGSIIDKENIVSDVEWLIEQAKKLDKIEQFTRTQDITLYEFAKKSLHVIYGTKILKEK